jgi:hypothetical protein
MDFADVLLVAAYGAVGKLVDQRGWVRRYFLVIGIWPPKGML